MIIIIMRSENFVAHLDGLGSTPVARHWTRLISFGKGPSFSEYGNEHSGSIKGG
jgi:hypothetical protein